MITVFIFCCFFSLHLQGRKLPPGRRHAQLDHVRVATAERRAERHPPGLHDPLRQEAQDERERRGRGEALWSRGPGGHAVRPGAWHGLHFPDSGPDSDRLWLRRHLGAGHASVGLVSFRLEHLSLEIFRHDLAMIMFGVTLLLWLPSMNVFAAPPKPTPQVFPTEVSKTSTSIQVRYRQNYFSNRYGEVSASNIFVTALFTFHIKCISVRSSVLAIEVSSDQKHTVQRLSSIVGKPLSFISRKLRKLWTSLLRYPWCSQFFHQQVI